MRIWYNNNLDNSGYMFDVTGNRVRIGRDPGNDIVLDSPFVAGQAAVLTRRGSSWELTAMGLNACTVDDVEVYDGEKRVIVGGQTLKIYPFTFKLELAQEAQASESAARLERERELATLIQEVHRELLKRIDPRVAGGSSAAVDEHDLLALEKTIEEIARIRGVNQPRNAALTRHIAGHCVRSELLGNLVSSSGQSGADPWHTNGHWSRIVSSVPDREQELADTVARASEALKLAGVADLSEQIGRVEQGFWTAWEKTIVREVHDEFKVYLVLRALKKEVKDIVFGYGPLEDLLRTPTVSEIMVVDREHIYVEKNGVLENSGRRFVSDDVTLAVIQRIVSQVGRTIDRSRPLVDARLTDGSRVNAVIPPLAVSGPCLTIRKFPARKLRIDDLVARGSLSHSVAEFLRASVITRRNILISGGTGSGKTTLLNCLSDFIPDKERIVTVEDTAELQLKKEHVVRLETKEANVEGAGAYTIRDLVKNALRMRPDRIVVGECRGAEALDMLQAMNTGHDGSLSTVHANNARDVILRLQVLVQMAADLPVASINRQIASAVDLVVQLTRLRGGRRVVSQVTELAGIDEETGDVRMRDLFLLEDHPDGPTLGATGRIPSFMSELIEVGSIQLETFYR
jgi:Flp pilus assembly CpaF family ATPase